MNRKVHLGVNQQMMLKSSHYRCSKTVGTSCRVSNYVNGKVRAILCDCRTFIGTMMAFDKHMNLILKDAVELHEDKTKGFMKRNLGLIILRGENIVSIILEAAPDDTDSYPSSISSPSLSSSSAHSSEY